MKGRKVGISGKRKSFAGIWSAWRTLPHATKAWYILLVLFVVQACVVATITKFGVPPDETNHIHFINYYTDHSISPILTDQTPTYNLGDKTREVDYLYHYSMSLIRRALPFNLETELHIIRLFSVAFAVLTFMTLRRVARRLGVSEWAAVVALAIASGLSMVLLMSAVVNNDVLVWLGVALGMLLLVRLAEKPRLVDLLWLMALVAYGGICKRTLLPISLVFALVGMALAARRWRSLFIEARRPSKAVIIAGIFVLIGVGLSAERIGGNVLRYGHANPTCAEVQGEEACYNFWANIREREMAAQPKKPLISTPEFVGRWFQESFINILDIQTQGWRHEVKPPVWLEPLLLMFVLAGTGYGLIRELRFWSRDTHARVRLMVLGLSVFYILFHLLVNYGEYRHYRVFGLALNGRYILAGLLPLLFLLIWYWSMLLERTPRWLRIGLALVFIAVLVWGSGLHLLLQNPQLVHG